jgi:hypothetical protein
MILSRRKPSSLKRAMKSLRSFWAEVTAHHFIRWLSFFWVLDFVRSGVLPGGGGLRSPSAWFRLASSQAARAFSASAKPPVGTWYLPAESLPVFGSTVDVFPVKGFR